MNRSDSLAVRTLLSIAQRRKGLDPARCRLVFAHLDTALLLQANLHRALAQYQLTDLQFGVLVVLFAFESEPISAAALATHTYASRSSITEALDHLEKLNLATRTRDQLDRRVIYVRITDSGRETVNRALTDYLRTAADTARYIETAAQGELLGHYFRLQEGATHPNS